MKIKKIAYYATLAIGIASFSVRAYDDGKREAFKSEEDNPFTGRDVVSLAQFLALIAMVVKKPKFTD
ncbi:MAG TPA: hypothetical protein VHE53_02585 [Patescibacteria group bacterium]|nr:hypothetical protein [Patescibacteria group bacterium]